MATSDVRAPRLVVTGPAEQAGMVLVLSAPQMVIGHSDTADLILGDRFVSRRHALVITDPAGQVTIQDLNSTSGTFINDERLTGPRVLHAGDTVRFADLVARFEPGHAVANGGTGAGSEIQERTMPPDAGPPSPDDGVPAAQPETASPSPAGAPPPGVAPPGSPAPQGPAAATRSGRRAAAFPPTRSPGR